MIWQSWYDNLLPEDFYPWGMTEEEIEERNNYLDDYYEHLVEE